MRDRSILLNHLNSDGFDCRSDGLFDPPRDFFTGACLDWPLQLALAIAR
jgi:hypothetical protein